MTENLNMARSILRMLKLRPQYVSTKDGGKSLNFSLGDVSSCESCLCKGNFDELNLLLLCFLRKKIYGIQRAYKAQKEVAPWVTKRKELERSTGDRCANTEQIVTVKIRFILRNIDTQVSLRKFMSKLLGS